MNLDEFGYCLLHEPSLCDRRPPSASKGNFTGHLMVGKSGPERLLYTASWLEFCWAHCLNAHGLTADLFEQVRFAWRDGTGDPREHFFDLLVEQVNGRRIAYTVKPEARLKASFLNDMSIIAAQARDNAFVDDVRLLTDADLDPIEFHNARMMHGMRRTDPASDEAVAAILAQMSGAETVAELTARAGIGAAGFRAVVRRIWWGELRLVRHERIAPETQVYKNGETKWT